MTDAETHSSQFLLAGVDNAGPTSEVVVMFIHGSLDRSAGMARLARLAQRTHSTLRFDRRGYGRLREHSGPFTVAGNTDDVVTILNGRNAVLVGHSYGGNIALATAERLGSQIRGVTTYETPLSWFDWWPQGSAGGAAIAAQPEDAAETFMIRMIGEKRWNELPQATKDQRRQEGRALTGELRDLRVGPPWNADNIVCPVICGHGTRGQPHHIDGAPKLALMLRNGESRVIEGAGHGAPISHPKEFFELLVKPHLEGNGTFTVTS